MWSFEILKEGKLYFVLKEGCEIVLDERFEIMTQAPEEDQEIRRFCLSASDSRFSRIQAATISPLSGAKYTMNGEEEEKITHLGTLFRFQKL